MVVLRANMMLFSNGWCSGYVVREGQGECLISEIARIKHRTD